MSKLVYTSKQSSSQRMKQFRLRLVARLTAILISLIFTIQRIVTSFVNPDINSNAAQIFVVTLPFVSSLAALALIEYLVFRKYGLRVLRYSTIIDLLFCLIYTGEWIVGTYAALNQNGANNYRFSLSGIISFAGFSWRTLLMLMITQKWQLKIIPPTAAYILLMWFGVEHQPSQTVYILVRGIIPVIFMIVIFYFDHKVNFILLTGNLQQEQWLQLNEFILDTIPENIAIMDLEGNYNFISEHFKKLMKKLGNSPSDIKTFFRNIKDIQQQQQENETDIITSGQLTEMFPLKPQETINSLHGSYTQDNRIFESQTITSLEDLIHSISTLITQGKIKEKSFRIFNGKFKPQEADAEERSFEIKTSFIKQDSSRYILLTLRDTTYRDHIMTLEGNIKYKDHLLASVSHELRTPLNGNINLLEAAIKSQDASKEIKERFLIPAVRSGKFLLHLINDMLDMSQMKAKKLRLVFRDLDLKETIVNTMQLLETHAKKKGISLETDLTARLHETFCTDHTRLSQIILNLVNNSIKFTQEGYVKLKVSPAKDMSYIVVTVEDSGIGMSKQDLNQLFKEFTHIDHKNREALNPTGVGLGLKIANDLTRLLGPKNNNGIIVDSILNHGSTFSFMIENKEAEIGSIDKFDIKEEQLPPVANEFSLETESPRGPKITRRNSIQPLIKKNIMPQAETTLIEVRSSCSCPPVLIVDDDPFNMLAYEAILNLLDVKYDCAYNGRSAIDKILNKVQYPCSKGCHPYRVVFMDEQMPGMTGTETVEEIVRLQRRGLVPKMNIIACTAHNDAEEIRSFLNSGVVEYIAKPISAETMKEVLDKYIS